MIRALYLRTAVVFAGALAVGVVVGLATAYSLKGEAEGEIARLVLGSGPGLLVEQLEDSDPGRWPEILERSRSHFDHRLRIVPVAHEATAVAPAIEVALPIGRTGQALLLGPVEGPSLAPALWPLFMFIATLVMVAGALFSLPLAMQLRRTQKAVQLLGEGRWDHRLDARAEGPLRSLAEHVNQSAAHLAAMFREREELLQAVSHELGTPLSRMRFQLEVLEPRVALDSRERIDQLRSDLDELDELSSELVGWVEAGGSNRGLDEFNASEVLEPLLELACQDAEHLLPRLEVAPVLQLRADRRQFQRALENLLRNAVRYARTTVVLSAQVEKGGLVIEVRDDGPGIPVAHRQRLFEPFTRVEGSRSREKGGLGLGLAIVHRIVTAHDGRVVITEAPEGGACLRSVWPT